MFSNSSKTKVNNEEEKLTEERKALRKILVHVDKININGLKRTNSKLVDHAIQNVFNATSFDELIKETNMARENLLELGAFKDVNVEISINKAKNATKDGYQVSFNGEELTKIMGTIGTEIGQNEGAMKAELAMPNVFGFGQRFSIDASYNNYKAFNFNMKYMKPLYHTVYGRIKPMLTYNLSRCSTKNQLSKFKTLENGLLIDFSCILSKLNVLNNFQYEFVERDVRLLDKDAPFSVREQSGSRLSSTIRHICTLDSRNENVFPTTGYLIRTTNEYSGLGGDTRYLSNNTYTELNYKLFDEISVQLCGRMGIISSYNDNTIPITNLLLLGGPLSLRGFKAGGAGENVDGCVIGTNKFWSTGIHLWAKLPFDSYFGDIGKALRLHCFYNCGNSNKFTLDNFRSACGCGIALRVSEKARIEANYTIPLRYQKDDNIQSGFQFGVGYEFI